MSQNNKAFQSAVSRGTTAIDVGLRAYMLQVYNYMAIGVGITGILAYLVSSNAAVFNLLVGTPLVWLLLIGQIGLVFYLSFRIQHIQSSTAQLLFWFYSALMGITLSTICYAYTGTSIARTFFVTAGSFAGLSLYGYTTKRDLTGFGSFLIIGLFGLVLSLIVNLLLKSTAFDFVISILGVFIFAGLTAYDTQQIKEMYASSDSKEISAKKAIHGALRLYLDFINLFLYLLRFLGDRR